MELIETSLEVVSIAFNNVGSQACDYLILREGTLCMLTEQSPAPKLNTIVTTFFWQGGGNVCKEERGKSLLFYLYSLPETFMYNLSTEFNRKWGVRSKRGGENTLALMFYSIFCQQTGAAAAFPHQARLGTFSKQSKLK